MTRTVATLGPSLQLEEARAIAPEVEFADPARALDLPRLGLVEGDRLLLIDGYFHQAPSVRHKEIAELLASGVSVFGAASMGALRSAEMAPLGMAAVGRIAQLYGRGVITSDEEVAVSHLPAEFGYRPLTVPTVEVRTALDDAVRSGLLGPSEASDLLLRAQQLFYMERTFEALLGRWSGSSAWRSAETPELLRRLREPALWQKSKDTRTLLRLNRRAEHLRTGTGTGTRTDVPLTTHSRLWTRSDREATGGFEDAIRVHASMIADDSFAGRLAALARSTIERSGATARTSGSDLVRRWRTDFRFDWMSLAMPFVLSGEELRVRTAGVADDLDSTSLVRGLAHSWRPTPAARLEDGVTGRGFRDVGELYRVLANSEVLRKLARATIEAA